MMKTGLIGLGIMGIPMAKNLINAGYDLMVSNRTASKADELLEMGAEWGTYEEIGAKCDRIILMVTDGNVSKEVLFGEGGVATAIKPGTIVCDMSSVTPEESRYCYSQLKEKGVSFIDAPVSGGEEGAINGTMVIMAGGDQAAFDAFKPLFDIMGSTSVLVGDSGAGSIAKLTNQVIVQNNIAVVAEAFMLAAGAGADPVKVYQAIRGGLAGSAVLDAKFPRMMERNFVAGGALSIVAKDVRNILSAAHTADVPVPFTASLYEILQTLKVHGYNHEDHAAFVRYFEMLAGFTIDKEI